MASDFDVRILLLQYAVCVLLVVVAEIATGITVAVYQNQVTDSVTRELQNVIDHYDYVPTELQDNNIIINGIVNVTNAPATATWNAVQVWVSKSLPTTVRFCLANL